MGVSRLRASEPSTMSLEVKTGCGAVLLDFCHDWVNLARAEKYWTSYAECGSVPHI